MTEEEASAYALWWVKAWNDHDVEEVLSRFADDALFTSPLAAKVIPGSDGVIRGKESLRRYWNEALHRNPRLHFDLAGAYYGVGTLVIHYRTQQGIDRCEVLTFGSGLVQTGHGTYPAVGGC